MTPDSGGRRSTSEKATLPPGRRALAASLQELYRHLGVASLKEAAQLFASRHWRKSPSEISRYRSGERTPPFKFVQLMHALAVERAGLDAVGLTLEELQEIHAAAESKKCRTCAPLREENEHLRDENSRLLACVPQRRNQAINGSFASTSPLPVPSASRDRQRNARDVAAARQLTATAVDFYGSGQTGYAISWLQDASSSLTPLESAASIALLRQEDSQLADAAIGISGRRHTHQDVIRIALELHEYGLPYDAGALLRAAVQ